MQQRSEEEIVNVFEKVLEKHGFEIDYTIRRGFNGTGEIICKQVDGNVFLGFPYSLESKSIKVWEGNYRGKPANAKLTPLDFNNLEKSLNEVLSKYIGVCTIKHTPSSSYI